MSWRRCARRSALPPLRRPSPRWPGAPAAAPPAYVCLRHGRWIGLPDIDHPTVDLAAFPEIVDATCSSKSRYGWAATCDAVLTALMICARIWSVDGRPEPFGTWDTWDDRLYLLIPFDREKQDYVNYSTSRLFAAIYPEAVTLSPLIASPYWHRMADGCEAQQARFLAEVATRITYPYSSPDRGGDAIAHWAPAESWRPPSRPLTTYAPGRVRGTLPGLAVNRLARHEKSALWLSRRSRKDQGRTLPLHGRLTPVLLRDPEPRYVKWEGTIWHSTRTDDLIKQEVARKRQELERTHSNGVSGGPCGPGRGGCCGVCELSRCMDAGGAFTLFRVPPVPVPGPGAVIRGDDLSPRPSSRP
ncbi:hypothetical protein [Streptomyces albireticuli]|uniref:hypothetical protein n=2 Tax=Streptomyces TaxID=1883 RepID=UPI0018FF07D0|nr:hypothetical protein [Streptomyces albireticuli]